MRDGVRKCIDCTCSRSVVAKSYDLSRVDRFGPTWKSSRSLLGSDLVRIVLRCVQKSEREFKGAVCPRARMYGDSIGSCLDLIWPF